MYMYEKKFFKNNETEEKLRQNKNRYERGGKNSFAPVFMPHHNHFCDNT